MTPPPSPQLLQAFCEICDQKSLTSAAQRLGVTQPSLSQGLKKLEDYMGVQLLIRDKKGIILTKSGQELYDHVQELMFQWSHLREKITGLQNRVMGPLKLGMHPAVGAYTLPHFLPELMQTFPDLELSISHELSRHITDQIINHKLDIGLVINPTRHPDLIIRPLFKDKVYFWRSKKTTPLNRAGSEHYTLIADHNLLQTQTLLKGLKPKQTFAKKLHLSNLENIARVCAHGAGVGIIPQRVVQGLGLDKNLETVDDLKNFEDQLCLVFHISQKKRESVRSALDFIQSKLS